MITLGKYTSSTAVGKVGCGQVISSHDFQAGFRGFESRSGRDNFQTISTPSSYSTCPGE